MAQILYIKTLCDERGDLSVIDGELGFEIKRVFYIYNVKAPRGGHAHHKTKLALICLNGSCEVKIHTLDSITTYILDSPRICLILEPSEWHTMEHFTPRALLLALASEPYSASDYIMEKPQ